MGTHFDKIPATLKGKVERSEWKTLSPLYDYKNPEARSLLLTLCRNAQMIADADEALRTQGLVLKAGKSGTPYTHPAAHVRSRAVHDSMRLRDRLDKFRVVAKPLDLGDDDEAPDGGE